MLDLSDEAGGVPRYVLQIPASIIRQENPNFKDQPVILNNQDVIKKSGQTLSTKNNASGYIFDKIQKKLEDGRWSNLFLKIQDPDDSSSSRGIMFESHVLHLFKLSGQSSNQGDLEKTRMIRSDKLTIATKPTTKYIQYANQLIGYNEEDIIIKPTIRNFSAYSYAELCLQNTP
ncbi:420_t:CDS:2 [Paraglomus brasilianum]|uniref:420_t:CDS:1 n=1 Tax=Paraglomus brasilianum TaxID=144538 RepID=A0A9N8YRM9_9GLOM|nr:420_t:CDS:2 [Paraglomus brasilianum]